jgi:hypothetical protein
MSWASERDTTRLEDRAYSLLGIFGINMPLLYGEGRRAFLRLQEEILKTSDDESLFVWDGAFSREELKLDMLAPDPAAFITSGRVALLPTMAKSSQYSISNKGLHMYLPFLSGMADGFCVGVLNCYYENDFSGYIGIRLRPLDLDADVSRETDDAGHYYRLGLCKVSEELVSKSLPTSIIICNSELEAAAPLQAFIEVKQPTTIGTPFKITPFMPEVSDGECHWNAATSILRVDVDSWPPVYLKMGFQFYSQTLDWGFVVAYALPWRGRQSALIIRTSTWKGGYTAWVRCTEHSTWTTGLEVGSLVENVHPPAELDGEGGPFDGDWQIRAEVHEEMKMRHRVWVLSTDIAGSKSLRLHVGCGKKKSC